MRSLMPAAWDREIKKSGPKNLLLGRERRDGCLLRENLKFLMLAK